MEINIKLQINERYIYFRSSRLNAFLILININYLIIIEYWVFFWISYRGGKCWEHQHLRKYWEISKYHFVPTTSSMSQFHLIFFFLISSETDLSIMMDYRRWVKEFLDEENKGLEVLIDYLSFRLILMR